MLFKLLFCAISVFSAGVHAGCNPLTTNGCPSIPGLASSSYSVDFTAEKSLPKEWILADASNITFGSNGVEFNFNKPKQAPYIWTNFYVAYGRIEVEMKVANGTGIISSAVMFSDDNDEIDWEFSGSNFGKGANTGIIQANVFGKGFTGGYDRGSQHNISPTPQTGFHTYTIDWTPEKIDWIVDGDIKRTEKNNGLKVGNFQFPQTPSRLHLGLWDAGNPDTAEGTRDWAGGFTNYSNCPYTAYVKKVKITTPYPCKAWSYPKDFSGSWSEVKCSNETVTTSTAIGTTSVSPSAMATEYVVAAGDNGWAISGKLGITFDQLSAVNPGCQWDFLQIGQKLNVPNFSTTRTSVSSPSSSSTKTFVTSGSSTIPSSSASYSCIRDDCYKSMIATDNMSSALHFCSSYRSISTLTTPTYLIDCAGDMGRVKSACNCLCRSTSSFDTSTTRSTSIATSTSSYWSTPTLSSTQTRSTSGSSTTSTTSGTKSSMSTLSSSTTITSKSTTFTTTATSKTTSTTRATTCSTTKTTSSKTTTTTTKKTTSKTTTTVQRGWSPWGPWKRDEQASPTRRGKPFGDKGW